MAKLSKPDDSQDNTGSPGNSDAARPNEADVDLRKQAEMNLLQPINAARSKRHLVIGAGQLGRALERALADMRNPVRVITRAELDLRKPERFRKILDGEEVDRVWLTAAATAVDWCEDNAREAELVNTDAPGVIAEICRDRGVALAHFSTDYVFSGIDGKEPRKNPYFEDDEPDPLSVYGRTKLEGEARLLDAHPDASVIRTSGLFSTDGKNFFNAVYAKGKAGETVRVVNDQVTAPTNVFHLAGWLARHYEQIPRDITHLAAGGGVSWRRAAEAAFELCGFSTALVIGITSEDLGRPATRPRYSVLGSRILPKLALPHLPSWLEGLVLWATEKTGRTQA
ncbi:NAD(P)-dependent oxidoreductase [bacterium]|nr:NAD(P)-dependent oxidoreductase [bacterium]